VRGVKLVGHRGYMLTGYGVFLNQAIINYGLEILFLKGTYSLLLCSILSTVKTC
jgi:seryl-tRNA synthetase